MNKILYVCSEAFPLIKTGGLADVAGSLPPAILSQGKKAKEETDIRLVLPAYPDVLKKIKKSKVIAKTAYYSQQVTIIESLLPGTKVKVWLVDCPAVFNRPGGPYSDQHGEEWHDNAFRFTIFCHTAVDLALNKLNLNWQPDVVHCNDWQTGLVPALLSLYKPFLKVPRSVFTIHNLAYQGLFDQQTFIDLHLPPALWHMNGVEFHGQFSFIKGGLSYADKITTVSPNYANEILDEQFGYGLSPLLSYRQKDLSGVVNGIDEKHWNPGSDKHIVQKYNRRTLDKKVTNKTALQKDLGLTKSKKIPMLGMVSRLVEQKGLELILTNIQSILDTGVQLVILGNGECHYEMQLCDWAEQYPKQLKVIIGYDEVLAHKIEASCDIYLMPSTFEPCGLNQLYSLRYGSLPLVTAVGGLADTVIHANEVTMENKTANGFVLEEQTSAALISTLTYSLAIYKQHKVWKQLQINAMSGDYSWGKSADYYLNLYQGLIDTPQR